MGPIKQAELAFCKCGCGQRVKQVVDHGKLIEYKPGHHRVKNGTPIHSQILKCAYCGSEKPSQGRKKYCSKECFWKARGHDTVPEMWTPGNKEFQSRVQFRVVRSKRLQRLYLLEQKDCCDQCGWGEVKQILEVHHVNHDHTDGRFENLRILCPTCHEMVHYQEKSGKYDNTRFERARRVREATGLPRLPSGRLRTTLQKLVDEGRLQVQ